MFKRLFNSSSVLDEVANGTKLKVSINNRKYSKVCSKTLSRFHFEYRSPYLDVYYALNGKLWIHITNKEFAHTLYLAVNENNLEALNKFSDLRFISIDKNEEIVFIVCERLRIQSEEIENVVSTIDEICNLLTTDETKLYVNYTTFFDYAFTHSLPYAASLFLSITTKSITLSSKDIEYILSCIFDSYYNGYNISFHTFQLDIRLKSDKFFSWLNKGVFIGEYSCYTTIPLPMFINFIKYAIDKSAFSSIHEFFKFDTAYENIEDLSNFNTIVDYKQFTSNLKPVSENEYFVNYVDNNKNKFSILKNSSYGPKLQDLIAGICSSSDDLEAGVKVVTHITQSNSEYWLLNMNIAKKFVDLNFYSKHFITESTFTEFLIKLHDVLYEKTSANRDILEKLRFQDGTNLLDCLFCNNGLAFGKLDDLDNICLSNLTSLELDDTKPSIKLDYILVLMTVIHNYLSRDHIDIKDIYNCEFSKIFHPSFIKLLIEYINNGSYDSKTIPKELRKGLIVTCNSSIVEFVEDIPLDDSSILARISFFNNANVDENLTKAVVKEKIAKANGYISLDSYLDNIDSYSFNKKNIAKIIYDYDKLPQDFFLSPEKIIISKELTVDNTYTIVGVLWNYGSLRNAIDVLKSDTLDCKQLYVFISDLLAICASYGCSFKEINALTHHLMINVSDNKPVLSKYAIKNITKGTNFSKFKKFYNGIIDWLESQGVFRSGYDKFCFDELTEDCDDVEEAYEQIKHIAKHLALCTKHNHWHIAQDYCSSCKKIYMHVGSTDSSEIAYSGSVADFKRLTFTNDIHKYLVYSVKGSYMYHMKNQILTQVELGIDHNLYNKFVGLVPKKIIKSTAKRNKSYSLGVLFNNFDFSNIISMDSFKNVQRLKLILVLYKKLLPSILDGSFIATNPIVFKTMFMHRNLKGEIVIPHLPLMECDVVISQDKELKRSKSQETKEIFANFLKTYIMTDEFLSNMVNSGEKEFVSIVQDIEQLNFKESLIRDCLNLYSNFCLVHSKPYANTNKLCPVCLSDGISESDVILTDKSYFDKLERKTSSYDGGEANIYPYVGNDVQKIFKNVVDLRFKSQILAKALQRKEIFQRFNDENPDIKIISVKHPLYMYEKGALQLKGFTQPFISGSYKISSLKDVNFVKKHGYKREDVVEILIKVCKGIEFLHANGGFIGDLNGGNILIKEKNVYFIDIDGMSFDEVRNSVYTNMYIYPPSAESNNITAQDDWYSLAIQAFYYLTYSHPFRGICHNKKVPSNEMERMKLGLSVLGNHSIVAPSISIGWHFLPDYLLQYFLDTFEGSKRESMLTVLEKYHKYLLENKLVFSEITRKRSVKINIDEHAYIDSDSNLIYDEQVVTDVTGCKLVISREEGFLIVLQNSTCFYNTITKELKQINKIYSEAPINILNGKIYYTTNGHRNIVVDSDFSGQNSVKSIVVSKPTDYKVVALSVIAEDKFVFVEKNTSNVNFAIYDIYCNSSKVASVIDSENKISERSISIRYDKLSRKWLAVFPKSQQTHCVLIESDTGDIHKFDINAVVSCSSCFYGNSLYFVNKGEILCYNTNREKLQTIECSNATPTSIVHRKDNKFVIINPTSAYMYEKP